MRLLKIIIPIFLLLIFALSLYIGSRVLAQSSCQLGAVSSMPGNPNPLLPDCSNYTYNPSTPFGYNSINSGITIAPSDTTVVYIMGGEPPYVWGDPGLGYEWANAVTSGVSNILICNPVDGGG